MGFLYSYKRLEKLCAEMFGNTRGITAYIDEMSGMYDGAYRVQGWREDLEKLKHYRGIRNKISHDPDCTEENMCEPYDEQWLENFHSRIMNSTDPLALYYKAKKFDTIKSGNVGKQRPRVQTSGTQQSMGCGMLVACFTIFVATVAFILFYL